MDMCNDQLKSKVDNERWIQELQEEEKLISAETTILTETLDYHRDATESCEFEITAKQEDRHVISDQQVLINKLEFENTMMELNFNSVFCFYLQSLVQPWLWFPCETSSLEGKSCLALC